MSIFFYSVKPLVQPERKKSFCWETLHFSSESHWDRLKMQYIFYAYNLHLFTHICISCEREKTNKQTVQTWIQCAHSIDLHIQISIRLHHDIVQSGLAIKERRKKMPKNKHKTSHSTTIKCFRIQIDYILNKFENNSKYSKNNWNKSRVKLTIKSIQSTIENRIPNCSQWTMCKSVGVYFCWLKICVNNWFIQCAPVLLSLFFIFSPERNGNTNKGIHQWW